jgi:sugar phosphate isomerase/epimerase
MECTRPARLEDRQLDEIRRLEERLGVVLVGYERLPRYRQLSPEELEWLRSIERETRSVLVAYEAPPP